MSSALAKPSVHATTRPIYHQKDETIRGHVFCSFLALLLRQELERRLEERGWTLEWGDIIRDLDHLDETTITVEEKPYIIPGRSRARWGRSSKPPASRSPPPSVPLEGSASALGRA